MQRQDPSVTQTTPAREEADTAATGGMTEDVTADTMENAMEDAVREVTVTGDTETGEERELREGREEKEVATEATAERPEETAEDATAATEETAATEGTEDRAADTSGTSAGTAESVNTRSTINLFFRIFFCNYSGPVTGELFAVDAKNSDSVLLFTYNFFNLYFEGRDVCLQNLPDNRPADIKIAVCQTVS